MMRDIGDVEEKEVEEKEVEEKPTTTNNKAALGVGIFLALVFTLVCGVMIGVLSIAGKNNPGNRAPKVEVGDFRIKCQSDSCSGHGQCYELAPDGLACVCDVGYKGETCQTGIDDCDKDPCSYGTCTDLFNDFECTCEEGYSGKKCDQNENECINLPSPCFDHGECVDQVNGFACICYPGYAGDRCETDIDDCESSPCINGVCSDLVYDFECACDVGFTGKTCGNDTDECLSSPCTNGTCVDVVDGFLCQCNDGWIGELCDDIYLACADERDPPVCKNDGECRYCRADSCTKSYRCNCINGYTGYQCEVAPAVDGGWSAWAEVSRLAANSTFSTSDGTCDMEDVTYSRACDSPAPSNGGNNCTGDATQTVPEESCTCAACNSVTIGIKLCSCDSDSCTPGGDCCDTLVSCS